MPRSSRNALNGRGRTCESIQQYWRTRTTGRIGHTELSKMARSPRNDDAVQQCQTKVSPGGNLRDFSGQGNGNWRPPIVDGAVQSAGDADRPGPGREYGGLGGASGGDYFVVSIVFEWSDGMKIISSKSDGSSLGWLGSSFHGT